MAIETVPLSPTLGVEITGVAGVEELLDDAVISLCLEALKGRGVVVVRDVCLDDDGQLAFTSMLGNVFAPGGKRIWHVGFGPAEIPALRNLESNFQWHMDGHTPDIPVKFTVLTARRVPTAGGGTEFADTYAAYASLPGQERNRLEGLRVVHTFEALQRRVVAHPSEQQLARWHAMPTHESWLVWKRRDGRRSLVIGTSIDHIVDMDADESCALLDDLLAWTTQERFCYAHRWQIGDLVVWDNTGLLHRALPYDVSLGRALHRTAIEGDEAWS